MSYKSRYARINGDREQQIKSLREKGYKMVKAKGCEAVAMIKDEGKDRCFLKLWQGKADKPRAWYRCNSMTHVENYVTRLFDEQRRKEEVRQERLKKRTGIRARDFWSVGDVVYNSWGYDQTNIDFYEVTKVMAATIQIRPIRRNAKDTGFMQGKCQPRRGDYSGPPMLKKVQEGGHISFNHGGASKWDGRALYYSYYA